jgi:GDP/UDP-N,N'-diacetylbacillosamine 2-epimerase (hydrolysing)
MKRKICVVTGTRAEYGLLHCFMKLIQNDPALDLQVVATGMHLSPEFGLTYRDIEKDGFVINKKVEMLLSADTPSSIAKSTGLGMIGFADAFNELQPDIVLIVGDRFEVFAAAFSAFTARIPIGHIHGGETTEGAFDEAVRHSITKMAWWHFVAAKEYKKRVIQLGEEPKRVHLVGGMGVDRIKQTKLLSKSELENQIDFRFGKNNILVTFHPVTLENATAEHQFSQLLAVLDSLSDLRIIFTKPNSDTEGRVIINMIDEFVDVNPKRSKSFLSLGQIRYLSTLQFIDAVVGNSSSGLLEAPTMKIGTINIGDRQKGRLKADSIIDCEPVMESIINAFHRLYSDKFQEVLKNVKNPYGKVNASEQIIRVLRTCQLPEEPKKVFYDL